MGVPSEVPVMPRRLVDSRDWHQFLRSWRCVGERYSRGLLGCSCGVRSHAGYSTSRLLACTGFSSPPALKARQLQANGNLAWAAR